MIIRQFGRNVNASQLQGGTLATGVTASSLTSFGASPTLVTPALGTPASGTINDSLTFGHDLTAVPNSTGGWTEYFVTGSDFQNSTTGLLDITGLVTGTLSVSTWYEFEAVLRLANASADTNGMKLAVHGGGAGNAAQVFSTVFANSSSATAAVSAALNAIDTGTGSAVITYASGEGIAILKGHFLSRSTTNPTMSIQLAHFSTSVAATCRVGSVLRIRKMHT